MATLFNKNKMRERGTAEWSGIKIEWNEYSTERQGGRNHRKTGTQVTPEKRTSIRGEDRTIKSKQ